MTGRRVRHQRANDAQTLDAKEAFVHLTAAAEDRALRRAYPAGRKDPHLTPPEVRALVTRIVQHVDCDPIGVTFYPGRGTGYADIVERALHLARHDMTDNIVLHHTAHILCGDLEHDTVYRTKLLLLAEEFAPAYGRSLRPAFHFYRLPIDRTPLGHRINFG